MYAPNQYTGTSPVYSGTGGGSVGGGQIYAPGGVNGAMVSSGTGGGSVGTQQIYAPGGINSNMVSGGFGGGTGQTAGAVGSGGFAGYVGGQSGGTGIGQAASVGGGTGAGPAAPGIPAAPGGWLGASGGSDAQPGAVGPITIGNLGTSTPQGTGVIALSSFQQSGPLHVGDVGDVHKIGVDADGNQINTLHFSTNSYFKRGVEDGPMDFEVYVPGSEHQHVVRVHLGFDAGVPHHFIGGPRLGKWRWWTTVPDRIFPPPVGAMGWGGSGGPTFWASDTPPRPPDTPPRVPPIPPPDGWDMHTPTFGPPPEPTPGGGGFPPVPTDGGGPYPPTVRPLDMPTVRQGYLARTTDSAFGSILGRAHLIQPGIPDLRKSPSGIPSDMMDAHDSAAPVTARVEAYGRQAVCEWNYTQRPGASRFVGGTAPGGFIVMPPELDMADDLNSWTIPACRAVSTTYFSVLRGSYFAAGLPNLVTGGMKTAHRWGEDANGNLTFEAIDSEGAATGALQLPTGGGATIAVGTSGSWMRPIGMVGADLSTVGTPATLVETTLDTITVPANSVTASGRGLRIKAFGTFAANDNAKTIKLKIGGVTIVTNDMSTVPNGSTWEMDAVVFRGPDVGHGPTTKVCAEAWVGAVSQSKSYATPALDYTAALPVIATGQNGVATANDIVGEGLFVEALG